VGDPTREKLLAGIKFYEEKSAPWGYIDRDGGDDQ
jgi:hypothetical protein